MLCSLASTPTHPPTHHSPPPPRTTPATHSPSPHPPLRSLPAQAYRQAQLYFCEREDRDGVIELDMLGIEHR